MARFVIALVLTRNSSQPFSQEVYHITDNCTPYNLKLPRNTIHFTFITANVETAQELVESFVSIKIGQKSFSTTSATIKPENNGKRYWIGKVIPIGDIQGIHNEHANVIIPFSNLIGNDEVIDL